MLAGRGSGCGRSWSSGVRPPKPATSPPMSFARVERGLLERIAQADRQAADAAPPLLRGLVGPDAAAKWVMLDTAAKREVIRMVARISVIPAGKGSTVSLPQRVQFAGLIAGDRVGEESQSHAVPTS